MSSSHFTIEGAAHTGFTVASLSQALNFWHDLLGLPILYKRNIDLGPEPNVVGVANAKMNTALLSLPNGHQLELLEYTSPSDRAILKPRPCDVGNVHLALRVTNLKNLIIEAAKIGWVSAADEPPKMKFGDGNTYGVCYIRGPDGITVEFIEKLE